MNWKDINIKTFKKIKSILNDNQLIDIEKNISLVSVIFGISEDDLYEMDLNQIKHYINQIEFVSNFEPEYTKCPKIKKIGDIEVYIDYNLGKFSVAQYMDFMANMSVEPDIARLLATFIIPKGKKYNTDYNIEDFIKTIESELNIYDAECLLFFYILKSLKSLRNSRKALMMKWMGNKMHKAMGFQF